MQSKTLILLINWLYGNFRGNVQKMKVINRNVGLCPQGSHVKIGWFFHMAIFYLLKITTKIDIFTNLVKRQLKIQST